MATDVWSNGELAVNRFAGPSRKAGRELLDRRRFQFTILRADDRENGYVSVSAAELTELLAKLHDALEGDI